MEELINVINTNNYSINLKNDYRDKEKINAYYPTFNNMRLLDKFLLSVENKVNGSVILSGAYGTGKSYFTALFISILGTDLNYEDYISLIKKAKEVYDISETIKRVKEKKYFIVFIDDTKKDFSEGVFSGIKKSLKEKNIDIAISSKIDIIESKLKFWENNHRGIYERFREELERKEFYKELKYKTKKVEEIFSEVYSNQFGGERFDYNGEIKDIRELLEDVEAGVKEKGYEGVIYVFDEFGRYLETNINNIDVKEIQDMAEYCNQQNSSNILMITHKDIFQYTRKLKNTFEKDEWEKVSGRFLKEHLIFEKTSTLEIIKNIIQKNNFEEFRKNNNGIILKEVLLKSIIEKGEKEYTEAFYPLDYVTALTLPDLSQKLAQNERTLFAFICSDDPKGLKSLISDKNNRKDFITADCLYDYFERELRQLSVESLEYKIYIISKDIISKIPQTREEDIRIVKALAMIYINNNFEEVKPNIETLRYIFNKEELDLSFLEENKYIVLNKYKNYYKLLESIDFDIGKKIEEYCEKKIGRFDYIKRLEEELGKENYYPLKYNDLNKINRYMGQYFVDVSDLSKIEELNKNYKEDGRIIYLTNIEENENYHQIIKMLGEKQEFILISGDGSKLDIYNELKELEAISYIKEDDKVRENETLKLELELYRKEIKGVISKRLEQFFNKNINLLETTNEYLKLKYPKYIGVNYELINKRNLSVPMRKARYEILKKLEANEKLEEGYFYDTKAESSLARVLLINTGIYNKNIQNNVYLKFNEVINEIKEDIQQNDILLEDLYKKYCSNLGEYGIREGIFTFLLGIICIENRDEITFSTVGGNGEINFTLDILDQLEKNPEKYKVAYYKIREKELEYFENLEKIIAKNIKSKDAKIYNRILDGVKNYLLNQPRYTVNIYLSSFKGLNKIFKNIFIVGNAKEFLLKELLRIYKTENYEDVIEKFQFEIISLEESKNSFIETLGEVTAKILSNGKFSSLEKYMSSLDNDSIKIELEEYLKTLKELSKEDILSNLTKKVKGFSYENWRNENDLVDYQELLKEEVLKLKKEKIEEKTEYLKIQFKDNEELIEVVETNDMLEKMLFSKISATIKNMGLSLTTEQKKRVIAKILLEMKG